MTNNDLLNELAVEFKISPAEVENMRRMLNLEGPDFLSWEIPPEQLDEWREQSRALFLHCMSLSQEEADALNVGFAAIAAEEAKKN